MTSRSARWWLRWPLAVALPALLAVWEHSHRREFGLPAPAGAVAFIRGGSLQVHKDLAYPVIAPGILAGGVRWPRWDSGVGWWTLAVPLWTLAAPLTAATAWAWWPRRSTPGRCAACGYNRAGLGAEAACPECGTGA